MKDFIVSASILGVKALNLDTELEKIRKAAIKSFNRDPFYGANTLCIVYGLKDQPLLVQDASCILENMFIAATSLGVDSCWINCLKDMFPNPETKLANELGLTEEYYVVGTCILGYRKDGTEIQVKPRKDDFVRYL